MSKYQLRGKFNNKINCAYLWGRAGVHDEIVNAGLTSTLIVRGIGFRAFALSNDMLASAKTFDVCFVTASRPIFSKAELGDIEIINQAAALEFPETRYLVVRAGHTRDLCLPLAAKVRCLNSKKDRKLVILSKDPMMLSNLSRTVHLYRPPSVYTGRGVRIKHTKPIRKAGKKDKQKGKAF